MSIIEKIDSNEQTVTLSPPGGWNDPRGNFSALMQHPWYAAIFEIQSLIIVTTHDFFRERSFKPVLTPVTTGSISSPMGLGSDSVPVSVNLFNQQTYLADSLQFSLEFLLRIWKSGVFYIMPSFRGEEPDATHLNQFFHVEAEMNGNLTEVIALINDYLRVLTRAILTLQDTNPSFQGFDFEHVNCLLAPRIPEITYQEALRILVQESVNRDVPKFTIDKKDERRLARKFGGAVWLTHLPANLVPFYQAIDPDQPDQTLAADLLLEIGEVVGCGQRHATAGETEAVLQNHGVAKSNYEWYCRMKAESPMVTSGFGLGVERFIAFVLKHHDIRDVMLFNRLKGYEAYP